MQLTLSSYTQNKLTHDPRHLLFQLARYKFVAKMLSTQRSRHVVEFGCGDGLGSLLISQEAQSYTGLDIDDEMLACATANFSSEDRMFLNASEIGKLSTHSVDLFFSLDVVEHLTPEELDRYFDEAKRIIKPRGLAIVGTPNIHASAWQSPQSKIAHINLQSISTLGDSFSKYGFEPFFAFGMNDETLHTGFAPMCHYIFMVGVAA